MESVIKINGAGEGGVKQEQFLHGKNVLLSDRDYACSYEALNFECRW